MATTTIERPSICGRCGDGPAIYVACLASYNNGDLHGSWINLEDVPRLNTSDIEEAISYILKTSPAPGAEEWAIHDQQHFPHHLQGEFLDLSDIVEYVVNWQEAEETEDGDAYRAYCNHLGQTVTAEDFRDAYHGKWDHEEEFAEDYFDQSGQMPEGCLSSYIDWDRVWYEVFSCDGWFSEYAGLGQGVWIFSPN